MADQGAEGLLSPYLRRRRFEVVAPWLNGRILDVGCGIGLLAEIVSPENYHGVEIDTTSLSLARKKFPSHSFSSALPNNTEKFDTVIALAVIEHVLDPVVFLSTLSDFLKDNDSSRILITTPHPSVDWVHNLGAKVGLFSSHASDEHEDLLNRVSLIRVGIQAGLRLESYSRFLLWANQVAAYSKKRA